VRRDSRREKGFESAPETNGESWFIKECIRMAVPKEVKTTTKQAEGAGC
jgi:hypothetical protein